MKILITGVAGYIGGSVAEKLVAFGHDVIGLARSSDVISALEARNIKVIKGTLDDVDTLSAAAQDADVVIHAANADHPGSVITLVTALERSGKTLIHTTGSAIVADHADGEYAAQTPLTEDDYFEPVPYRRPRVDMNRYLRQAAIEKGIRSIVICPTMVYGAGRGLHTDSDQIPKLIGLSKQVGAGVYFGKGLNRYSNIHIDDLVSLYVLALEKAPGGSFYFAENGCNSFREIAAMISTHLGFGDKTASLPIEGIVQQFGEAARLGVGSNSYVRAVNARRIMWEPVSPSLSEWFQSLPKQV